MLKNKIRKKKGNKSKDIDKKKKQKGKKKNVCEFCQVELPTVPRGR